MEKQSATQDIGNVVDAYRKAYGTIQGEKRAPDDYYTDKLGMIKAIIDPNDKDLVSDVKKEFDDKITSWRDKLETLNGIETGSIASADKNCKDAQKDRDKKGETYDELKQKQKSIEEEAQKAHGFEAIDRNGGRQGRDVQECKYVLSNFRHGWQIE